MIYNPLANAQWAALQSYYFYQDVRMHDKNKSEIGRSKYLSLYLLLVGNAKAGWCL